LRQPGFRIGWAWVSKRSFDGGGSALGKFLKSGGDD